MTEPRQEYGAFTMVSSAANARELPVLVFTPSDYDSGVARYPVLYLLHGVNDSPLTEQGMRSMNAPESTIQQLVDFHGLIIVMPMVGNTFYLDSPKQPSVRMATYVGEELPRWVDGQYRTIAERQQRFLAGFSMGGYGAVSLLCRYPETFSVALSRAGVMELAMGIVDHAWDDAALTVDLLGSYWQEPEAYHRNSCPNLLNRLADRKEEVGIVLEVGREDILLPCNQRFRDHLHRLGIPHIYAEYPGGHSWSAHCLFSLLAHLDFFRSIENQELP